MASATCLGRQGKKRLCFWVSERLLYPFPLSPSQIWPGSHLVSSLEELAGGGAIPSTQEHSFVTCGGFDLFGSIPTLYGSPMAAPINYHKLSGFGQHELSYSSRGQKSNMGLTWLRSRCWQGVFLLGDSRGLSEADCIIWLFVPFPLQSHYQGVASFHMPSLWPFWPLPTWRRL